MIRKRKQKNQLNKCELKNILNCKWERFRCQD